MALQLPAHIGKYELEEFLGGGMSHVYRARDTVIGRTVAVKILTDEGCQNAETKARFLQEARMAGNISHENVVSVFDFGEDEQHRPFMVMEFLRGEDLRHAIKGGRTGDLRNQLRIAVQTAWALGYIHSLKIIHRDIKPDNIHLTPAGQVKLMDFGIAKTEGFSMTRTGFVMGTPYYMAPEQVLSTNVGEAADIYSFGVLLFELLSGQRPIMGETIERIFYAILNEPLNLEPLHQIGIPAGVCDLVARCTAKDIAKRPPSFEAVAEEIEGLLAAMDAPAPAPAVAPPVVPARTVTMGQPEVVQPEIAPPPSSKRWMLLAAIAAIVVAGGLVAWLVLRGHSAGAGTGSATGSQPQTLEDPTGEMVLMPAGSFLSGKNKVVATLPALYVDRTEVTNRAYKSFVEATGYALPADFPADKPDLPVVNVSIEDARAFARWARKRLPNSQEWERAARGDAGWIFPWGDANDSTRANVKDNPQLAQHALMPVGSFARGASPFKTLDMVGNAWEFVDQADTPDPRNAQWFKQHLQPPPRPDELWYVARGESYNFALANDVLVDWVVQPARWKAPDISFRCVRDVTEAAH